MTRRLPTRWFVVGALLVCLVLAGAVSYYASNSPDGLNRVAADHGLSAKQKQSATHDSPLAGYDAKGVDNTRLSGGLAGIAGVVVVLALMGGLVYVVRRKHAGDENAPDGDDADNPVEPSQSRG